MNPTDTQIARAQALGRAAGRDGLPLTSCPYTKAEPVLRVRWGLAHAGAQAQ